ncbi:MAG: acyltransferase family protein, partial [Acidimicrobiales bacterium]
MTATMQQRGAPGATRRRRAPRYRPGLDGLRAFAVAAVVAYHLAPGVVPGGFLGVDVFFVISGYLITGLLVEEWRSQGTIGLPQFWLRRIRRLYPAIVALLAVLVIVTAVADRSALATSRVTIPIALVYQTNWWFIFHHVPYFQRFGPPPLLLHLWSLAIEEQYYLLWPPLLLLMLRAWRRRGRIVLVALGGAVLSAILMAALYHGGASVNRVYYGTDTHAEGLLLGSALGLLAPPGSLSTRIAERSRRTLDRAAAVSLAGLVLLVLLLGQGSRVTWDGGLMLAVILAAVAVLVAAHPATRTGRLLAVRPLRWLGTRSYSVYLWHWPVIVLTGAQGAFPLHGAFQLVARLAATAGLAEVSYRWVERPWRTGVAARAIRAFMQSTDRMRRSFTVASASAFTGLVVLVAFVPAPAGPAYSRVTETVAAAQRVVGSGGNTTAPAHAGLRFEELRARATPLDAPPAAEPRTGVLAIGDSVMLAAEPDLVAALGPGTVVDAAVGRQVYAGLERLAAYKSTGRLDTFEAVV